ncbi:hypothetical protein MNEG_13803 [Monoraphidium neglectum]|uniref:Uncharacterized protein n=1 Tax=Monoraphidium neglectum TaxID=145388 RepID=A0A0D2LXG4_9CHLO|nr:hypothetical protein MNEG_13803 [Monoraphidium neglectum]KIY94161.1 hypothetical protein MNEG_13803 [Monoraphidium neglectum]|eukprot:XP_013893181.1 hypothetical protein MNEG_13803 [Monoraphidium neglectum]
MTFELSPDARMSVSLECDNGLTKRYRLDALEADILHASVDKDAFPTSAVAEAAELNK